MNVFRRLRKIKILLIDGDEWIRDSLSLLFEGEGCRLAAYETAEEAMEVLKNRDYDILIADYKLPGMDGLEFFRRVQEFCPRAMKILITAYGSDAVVSEAIKIGIRDFIEKPFTAEAIERSFSRLIQREEGKIN